jgi:hypothetical protein
MKRNTVLLVILMALAGCSASYKGDIKGLNKPDAGKNESYVVSQAGTAQQGVSIVK